MPVWLPVCCGVRRAYCPRLNYVRLAPGHRPLEARTDPLRPALEALSWRRTTLTEFAGLAGIPSYTAARMVRATTGWSFRELHRALLTERAQDLLRSGRAVKVVAIELGFSCSASLCRFLRHPGARMAPAFLSAQDRFPDSSWLVGAPRPAAE